MYDKKNHVTSQAMARLLGTRTPSEVELHIAAYQDLNCSEEDDTTLQQKIISEHEK